MGCSACPGGDQATGPPSPIHAPGSPEADGGQDQSCSALLRSPSASLTCGYGNRIQPCAAHDASHVRVHLDRSDQPPQRCARLASTCSAHVRPAAMPSSRPRFHQQGGRRPEAWDGLNSGHGVGPVCSPLTRTNHDGGASLCQRQRTRRRSCALSTNDSPLCPACQTATSGAPAKRGPVSSWRASSAQSLPITPHPGSTRPSTRPRPGGPQTSCDLGGFQRQSP